MSNKFKIRNLENEIRRIQKEIVRLKKEDATGIGKIVAVIKEQRKSDIISNGTTTTVDSTFKYIFKTQGNKVMCTLTDGVNAIYGEGISTCHEDDKFDLQTGCIIAERRAIADFYNKLAIEVIKEYN